MSLRAFVPAAALAVAALAALGATSHPAAAEALSFFTAKGTSTFELEIAESPEQRMLGLMFRKELAPDHGMIFLYHPAAPVTMWMKNTYIPLDMVFVGADHKVLRIAADTVPLSETHIPSGGMVDYVIELNAGTAARIGLAPGDRVAGPALR